MELARALTQPAQRAEAHRGIPAQVVDDTCRRSEPRGQRAELGEHPVPAILGAGHELVRHGQRGRLSHGRLEGERTHAAAARDGTASARSRSA